METTVISLLLLLLLLSWSLAAAAAFRLHSIPMRWAEQSIIHFKNEGTRNGGSERKSEFPRVTQQRAWRVPSSVCEFQKPALLTQISHKAKQMFREFERGLPKASGRPGTRGQAQVTTSPPSWWISLSASLGLQVRQPACFSSSRVWCPDFRLCSSYVFFLICLAALRSISDACHEYLDVMRRTHLSPGLNSPFEEANIWSKTEQLSWGSSWIDRGPFLEAWPPRLWWVLDQRSEPESWREELRSLRSTGSSAVKDHLLA